MSRFFVGQRVRIVRTYGGNRLLGTECRITGWVVGARAIDGTNYDGWGLDVKNSNGFWCVAKEGDIEPILDQHQPCESEFKESLDKLLEGLPA